MGKKLDLTGKRFGLLTVQSFAYYSKKSKKNYWNCLCACGNTTQVSVVNLTSGTTKSCGCYADYVRRQWIKNKKRVTKYNVPANSSNTKLYSSYIHMRNRCCNPNCDSYKYYGARGISICKEWLDNPQSFFDWALKNGWEENLSIDRIDVNGNYEPSNCRWANDKTQANNTRRNKYITYKNQTRTLSQWAEILKMNRHSLGGRLLKGWSVEKAFTTPIKTKGGLKNEC